MKKNFFIKLFTVFLLLFSQVQVNATIIQLHRIPCARQSDEECGYRAAFNAYCMINSTNKFMTQEPIIKKLIKSFKEYKKLPTERIDEQEQDTSRLWAQIQANQIDKEKLIDFIEFIEPKLSIGVEKSELSNNFFIIDQSLTFANPDLGFFAAQEPEASLQDLFNNFKTKNQNFIIIYNNGASAQGGGHWITIYVRRNVDIKDQNIPMFFVADSTESELQTVVDTDNQNSGIDYLISFIYNHIRPDQEEEQRGGASSSTAAPRPAPAQAPRPAPAPAPAARPRIEKLQRKIQEEEETFKLIVQMQKEEEQAQRDREMALELGGMQAPAPRHAPRHEPAPRPVHQETEQQRQARLEREAYQNYLAALKIQREE